MKWVIAAVAIVLVAGVQLAPEARAESVERARAARLYQEARGLYEAGLIREALTKLKQAYDLSPDEGILMSIVNRHMELGEPEEAAAMLSLLKPSTPAMREQATELQKTITAALAEPVTVQITATPDDASVSVDGGASTKVPTTVRLTRGDPHTFEFKAPGYDKKVIKKELKGSNVFPLNVKLDAHFGRWQVKLEPEEKFDEVRVLFDEVQVMLSKNERDAYVTRERSVRPGTYEITCLRGVDVYVKTSVDVVSDESVLAVCRFPEQPIGLNTIMGWSAAGAALGAFAGGTVMLVSYLQDVDKYADNPNYTGFETSKDIGAYSLYGVGALLTATSVLFFTDVIDLE